MPIYEGLCAIPWPSESVVEYADGQLGRDAAAWEVGAVWPPAG